MNLKISPSGKFIAYLKKDLGQMNLFVEELQSKRILRVTSDSINDVSRFKWGNDETLVYLKDNKKDENFHLFEVNRRGGKSLELTPFNKVRVDWWEDEPTRFNKIYFEMNRRDPELQDLYSYNLHTKRIEMVYLNPGQTRVLSIKTDNQGVLRVIILTNGLNQSFLCRSREAEIFKQIFQSGFKDKIYPISFDANNRTLYASSNRGRDHFVIIRMDPSTGKELERVYQNPNYDVGELYYSVVRKRPIYAAYTDWKNRIVVLDSSVIGNWEKVVNSFPNLETRVVDMDSSETHFILRIFNDRNLGYYYLLNRIDHSLVKLADLSPWIKAEDMCAMKPIQFRSRDGIMLNGYLTLPKGGSDKNYPMIVSIHSNPYSRNIWAFDRESQFFANRGYAVLQINYRGSSGYGKSFYESGFKQWGGKIQNDITDATLWAIHQGIADSNRIALYGYGFGGYCALMGAVRAPNLYSCVISYSGISNVFDYIKDVPPLLKITSNRLYEIIGNPETEFNLIKDISPVFHVHEFHVPVFIAQGAQDNRVSINETDYFVRELRKSGVKVNYFVRANEGSLFTNDDNKLSYYSQLESFLSQNMKK